MVNDPVLRTHKVSCCIIINLKFELCITFTINWKLSYSLTDFYSLYQLNWVRGFWEIYLMVFRFVNFCVSILSLLKRRIIIFWFFDPWSEYILIVVLAVLLGWYQMQRPLKTIAIKSGDVYIPRGVSVPALDKDILWEFQPKKLGIWNPLVLCSLIFKHKCLC